MVYELRTYQIQPGKMEEWVALFEAKLRPVHEQYGLRVLATWRNEAEENEFIWIRVFPDEEQRPLMSRAMYEGPEWAAFRGELRGFVASTNVKVLTEAGAVKVG